MGERIVRIQYGIERVFIRSLRIACALIPAAIGVYFSGDAIDLLAKPFASSSVLTILGGIALGYLAFLFFWFAWFIAFSEGPSKSALDDRIKGATTTERSIKGYEQ